MPPLPGFSDNPLVTRNDVTLAAESLLKPLTQYFSPGNARVTIPVSSGAHFDEVAAQLEGYARPLWVVASLLQAAKHTSSGQATNASLVQPWLEGLSNGVNPNHAEYWGTIGDWDQRMVEAEILSFTLLAAPEAFYNPLDDAAKTNLANWLMGLNGKVMPENNWRWFRVLSNLALIQVCGVEHALLWPLMEQDLELLDKFYISDGWSSDGIWRPASNDANGEGSGINAARGRHADYYSGSFAIQFSQMLYTKFAGELDPKRCSVYKARAKDFISSFWAYFDTDGAAIPFGRSLCYKFAMGGFYAAFAYADLCEDTDGLSSYGAVKGMLLRHLRWWSVNSENIFATDGTLNIGYCYPNMYISEDYNSPQSPYWALKSLIVVALAAEHPFWSTNELCHPQQQAVKDVHTRPSSISVLKPPRQILCNHPEGSHHFLLSSGQFCVWPMKATQAKYAKFAYSSAFGFSVPTGPLITQLAPDSTLALSQDDGESWSVRWVSQGDTQFVTFPLHGSKTQTEVPALVSRWKPWARGSVEVESTVIAPCDSWPDWHVRVHRIRVDDTGSMNRRPLTAIEGGFAVDGRRQPDRRYIAKQAADKQQKLTSLSSEDKGTAIEWGNSSLVVSTAGASGVVDLSPVQKSLTDSRGEILKPDPNTNLMTPRTLLPIIRHGEFKPDDGEVVIATAVFAIASKQNHLSLEEIDARWTRKPVIVIDSNGGLTLK